MNVMCVAIMVGIWRHDGWPWVKSLIVGALMLGVFFLLSVRSAKRISRGQSPLTFFSSRK